MLIIIIDPCLHAFPIISTRLRTYIHYTRLISLCAFSLTNKRLTCFFVFYCVASIVWYSLRLRNPRLIPLKVIKFALNITNSYFFNIIVKDLKKNKYSEEPKTAFVRPIFKKNKRNKIGN